jgi:hypothetical protein
MQEKDYRHIETFSKIYTTKSTYQYGQLDRVTTKILNKICVLWRSDKIENQLKKFDSLVQPDVLLTVSTADATQCVANIIFFYYKNKSYFLFKHCKPFF